MSKLSPQRWAEILSAFPTSGLSHRDFAQLHRVSVHTFRAKLYAASCHESPAAAPMPPTTAAESFLRLQVLPPAEPVTKTFSTPALVLALGDSRLDFAQLPEPSWLAALLARIVREEC